MSTPPEAQSNPDTVRQNRRRFAHFSLASLMLEILLAGSAATDWWRWDAWVLKNSINSYAYDDAFFSPDGKRLVIFGSDWSEKRLCADVESGSIIEIPHAYIIAPDGH